MGLLFHNVMILRIALVFGVWKGVSSWMSEPLNHNFLAEGEPGDYGPMKSPTPLFLRTWTSVEQQPP